MNFLCLGTAFLLFQMDLSSWINYAVKLVGCVLFYVGLNELGELCRIQHTNAGLTNEEPAALKFFAPADLTKLYTDNSRPFSAVRLGVIELLGRRTLCTAALCGGATVWFIIVKIKGAQGLLVNITAALLGFAAALTALWVCYGVIGFIFSNDCGRGANDESILHSAHQTKHKLLQLSFNPTDVHRLRENLDRTALCMGVFVISSNVYRLVNNEDVQTVFGFFMFLSGLTFFVLLAVLVSAFNNVRTGCNRKFDDDNGTAEKKTIK